MFRKNIGNYLKELRLQRRRTLNQVVAELSNLGVSCSHAHLSRIELSQSNCRSEIVAGLSVVYKVPADQILFEDVQLTA